MYDCYKSKIVAGAESFSITGIIGENLLYLATWIIAGYLLFPVWVFNNIPVLTIAWVLLVVIIQILLKKHNCSGCYYYGKVCHLGWGKISSALFEQDSGDIKVGMRLNLFYIVSPPAIFLTSIGYAVVNSATLTYWVFLIIYVLFNILSFPVRKYSCSKCAMAEVCPGSAA